MYKQEPVISDIDESPNDPGSQTGLPRKRSLMWLPIRGTGVDNDPLMPDHEPKNKERKITPEGSRR
jgi:hypothetical protein